MKSFNYFFGLVPGEVLLRHTDNLSRTLQKNISAPEEGGLKTVCTLFRSDLHAANLRSQLEILSNNFSSSSGDTVEVPPFHMDTVNRFSAFTWATYPVLNPVIMTFNPVQNLVCNCISNRFVGAQPYFRCEQYGGTWKVLDGGGDEAPDTVESGQDSEATARGQAER